MVEVLLESGGQDVAVVSDSCAPASPSSGCRTSSEDSTAIQRFYEAQNVFVTGGTGFVGKLLIEKLLRSCPGIGSIYLLVRPKKGKDIYQRTDEIFDDPLFARLKRERPKFRHQIIAVSGDCSLPGLGINTADRTLLCSQVSIVFHVAATVRFDEKMKLAVSINVQSPRDVLRLCRDMPNLKACVHVSTAYANCVQDKIEERFYAPPIDGHKLISLMECMDEKLVDDITKQLIGKWPNTYTYTKAVAEDIVRKESAGLPVGIFRPAVVISTYREPLRGWIDNMYGPTGVAAGAGTGLLRTLHCDGAIHANVVPGDMTVNALVASAWDVHELARQTTATTTEESCDEGSRDISRDSCDDRTPIYNFVCKDNPITWDEVKLKSARYGIDLPTSRAVWYYSFRNTRNKMLHQFYIYILHLLPALLVDTVTFCIGKQPRMLRMYKKIHRFMEVLDYFTTKEWVFTNSNVHALIRKMERRDRELFLLDMRDVVWESYFQNYIKGIRLYLIKDPIETLPMALIRWRRMYWLHQALKIFLTYCALRFTWFCISELLSVIF